jgi:putative transcriptional regulator
MGRLESRRQLCKARRQFRRSARVFKDPFAVELLDDSEAYGEDRFIIIGMADNRLLFVVYTMRSETIRIISARGAEPMSNADITKATAESPEQDWSRFDAMSGAQRHAAAASDPEARPLSPDDFKRMKRTPQVTIIRRALGLSQEEFSVRFHIPLGTLRDWEQGRKAPDAAARAYLVVIGRNPQAVREALSPGRDPQNDL